LPEIATIDAPKHPTARITEPTLTGFCGFSRAMQHDPYMRFSVIIELLAFFIHSLALVRKA